MTIQSDVSHRGTQNLTSESDDKIVVDRQTLQKLLLLLECCADNLSALRQNEIFLTCLGNHLKELQTFEADKAYLLLGAWLDESPDVTEAAEIWLHESLKLAESILTDIGGQDG